jgi:hypothetical protein
VIQLEEAIQSTARRLDDPDNEVWGRSELASYLQDGADLLCRRTNCLFDMAMFSNAPLVANHTRKFEEAYFKHDWVILDRFNFTNESERPWASAVPQGPCSNTRPSDAQYVEQPQARSLGHLPEDYTQIERVTHDKLRLGSEFSRTERQHRNIYKTETGGVYSYSLDEDGLFELRTVGIPIPTVPTVEISGLRGVIRRFDSTQFPDEPIVGDYGIIRQVPKHFPSGSLGAPRRILEDTANTRVELYRLGKRLSDHPFEIPDRYVKYVEWWALFRAYSKDGPGQEKVLADHYRARFEVGVGRMTSRIKAEMDERPILMGGKRNDYRDSYLSHFPSTYGRTRPFRRGA